MEWVLLFWLSPILFLLATYGTGKTIERAHQRSLLRRQEELQNLLLSNLRRLPPDYPPADATMCSGSVVVASDYFKRFAASLKTLVGGRLRTLESLLFRARQEALLRALKQAQTQGADAVFNIRFETATIGFGAGDKGLCAVEVVAYGTAVRRKTETTPYRGTR